MQNNGLSIRIGFIKVQEKFDVSITPCVNGLIGIADNEKIFMFSRQHLCDEILSGTHILEFIDHHVLHPFLPLMKHFWKFSQNVGCEINQIIEVTGKIFLLFVKITQKYGLVYFIGFCDAFFKQSIIQRKNFIDIAVS